MDKGPEISATSQRVIDAFGALAGAHTVGTTMLKQALEALIGENEALRKENEALRAEKEEEHP